MRSPTALASILMLVACSGSEVPLVAPAGLTWIQPKGPGTCAQSSSHGAPWATGGADTLYGKLYCGAAIGATLQFHAIGRDASFSDLGELRVNWSSSDTRVARVSRDGSVTGIGKGVARITGSLGNQTTVVIVAFETPYDVAGLGTFGGPNSFAYSLNEAGHVVGWAETPAAVRRAFVWNGQLRDIGSGAGGSEALDINQHDDVVGNLQRAAGATRAFVWRAGTTLELGSIDGGPATSSSATAINDAGHIVGRSAVPRIDIFGPDYGPTLWRDGTIVRLGAAVNNDFSPDEGVAFDINNADIVVGTSHGSALAWNATDARVLLRGAIARGYGATTHAALALNDAGVVVGYSQFLYTPPIRIEGWEIAGDRMSSFMNAYVGAGFAEPYTAVGLNAQGIIVGTWRERGLMWRGDAPPFDLNMLVRDTTTWLITEARAINSREQIAANGVNRATGARVALLLTPVP
jgi:probable HAF family extracellular repeat protein